MQEHHPQESSTVRVDEDDLTWLKNKSCNTLRKWRLEIAQRCWSKYASGAGVGWRRETTEGRQVRVGDTFSRVRIDMNSELFVEALCENAPIS